MAKSTSAATAVAQHITDATVGAEASTEAPAAAVAPEAPKGERWRDKHYTSRVLLISDTRTARVVAGHVSIEQGDEELRTFLQEHADFERVEE